MHPHRDKTMAATTTTTYENSPAWRKQMAFLPPELHLTPETMPTESTWAYKGHAVHVDSCGDPVTSPITLIMLHGTWVWVGGSWQIFPNSNPPTVFCVLCPRFLYHHIHISSSPPLPPSFPSYRRRDQRPATVPARWRASRASPQLPLPRLGLPRVRHDESRAESQVHL